METERGTRLAEARAGRGLTQRELAGALGVTVRTIQNYESGKHLPSRHLDSLVALLGSSVPWILSGSGRSSGTVARNELLRQRARLGRNLALLEHQRGRLACQLAECESQLARLRAATRNTGRDDRSRRGGVGESPVRARQNPQRVCGGC